MTKVKKKEIRVRIAPSPTGYLHIGTARTALFNWLFARHHTGAFIVRIEDTDLDRSDKKYEKDILDGLEWLGLKWDELYRQSERAKYYSKYIKKLLDEGKAFWCYHSPEELEAERLEQLKGKDLPRHVCGYRSSQLTAHSNQQGIIRLAGDEGSTRKVAFDDVIRGRIEFEERLLGDISIAKNEETPLYNFAAVVDDKTMEISHVIRGEDHIANTPKQILIAEALGFTNPRFGHLPLILGPDKSKLSKRHGAASIIEYRRLGYLADALVNFMALLGWTPLEIAETKNPSYQKRESLTGWTPSENQNKEILTKNQLIELFDLTGIHKSGAVFDVKKLNWINSQYIKTQNDEGMTDIATPFIEKHFGKQDRELLVKLAPLFRERLEYLDQVREFHYFFKQPSFEPSLLVWKSADRTQTKKALDLALDLLANVEWNDKSIREGLDKIAGDNFGADRGAVYWPSRVALSGEKFSPDPVEIMKVLGKDESISRVQKALKML